MAQTARERARAAALRPFKAQWKELAVWQRRHLELAAELLADVAVDDLDHRERRLSIETAAKLQHQAVGASAASASDAGRALVAHRYRKSDYRTALEVLEGGA
jgi:hypothetical protein